MFSFILNFAIHCALWDYFESSKKIPPFKDVEERGGKLVWNTITHPASIESILQKSPTFSYRKWLEVLISASLIDGRAKPPYPVPRTRNVTIRRASARWTMTKSIGEAGRVNVCRRVEMSGLF